MKISDLKKLTKEQKIQIIEKLNAGLHPGDVFGDLNAIHKIEIVFLEILVEFSHWLQLSEIMNLSRALQIGHWPAEASERADAFIFTISKFLNCSREKLKSEKLRVLQDVIIAKKIF